MIHQGRLEGVTEGKMTMKLLIHLLVSNPHACLFVVCLVVRLSHDVYSRADEQGTPFCITVDFDSLEDNTVTVRSRDSMQQVRIKIDDLFSLLSKEIDGL